MARDGQLVHLLTGIVGNVQPVKKLLRIGVHLRVVYEHPLARLAAQPDVLGNGHFGNRVEFLIDHRNAHFQGIRDRVWPDLLALVGHRALVGDIGAVDDLHER